MDLLHTTFLGAAVTGIMALYGQVKNMIDRIIGLFIVRIHITGEAGEAMSAYLWKNGKIIRWGPRHFRAYNDFVKTLRACQLIPYEGFMTSATIFFVDKKPLWISLESEGGRASHGNPENISISFFRWSFKPEKLMLDALAMLNETRKGKSNRHRILYRSGTGSIHARNGSDDRKSDAPTLAHTEPSGGIAQQVFEGSARLIGYDISEVGAIDNNKKPFDIFIFDDHINIAIEEIQFWKENENWFKDRSIPWRRGWMLAGDPGTGKTTLVRCIGQHLDLPVIVFDLASMSNAEFEHAWDSLSNLSPCIALIEDIDRVFNKDVNVIGEQGGGLSFDKLLNCISGIKVCDGVFTIITTNHIDKVDPALGITQENGISSRPGRMDRIIKIGKPSEKARTKIADRILCDFPFEIAPIVIQGKHDTVAQFQDRCCQRALWLFWVGYKK